MLQPAIPKIILNDDSVSLKSSRTNSGADLHHVLKSTKNSSESLFKYNTTGSEASEEKVGDFEDERTKRVDVDDLHVPVPDCFLHSTTISEDDFRHFVKRKRIDLNSNRFGEVFRYVDTRTMIPMVGNIIKLEVFDSWSTNSPQKEKKISEFIEDVQKIAKLRHRRISHLYGIFKNREKMIIFNEYVPRGSVFDKVRKSPIDERTAIKYFRQAMEGLRYIHSREITHGNIRASNLLITFSDDIKITDFAFSYDLTRDSFEENPDQVSNYRIKLLYAAPESIQMTFEKYPPSVDIWALGCVFVVMLTQTPPYYKIFKDMTDQEVYRIITDNYSKPVEQRLSYSSGNLIPQASEDSKILLDFVMNDDQFVRPTAEEVLENQVVKQNILECRQIPFFSFKRGPGEIINNGGLVERIFIFLFLMLKWALMVFVAALTLAGISSTIFLSIVIIYRLIKMSCQCELNEGKVKSTV
ncbi:hypothetical protein FO519_003850 [Halicephalobus sp. NKZ332]|nr:hypothetical protein FO519_003850 [Halicephalobus sp. NKZ332]